MVEVWFNQEIAKNFFSWVIPLSENRVRCGLATSMKNGHETLSRFVEKRFNKEISTTINSGLVCTGGPIAKTAYQGLLLVGDVAGQVKPTTGGGVVIGGLCAKIAGEISVKVLGEVGSFYDYEKEWRGKYGSELQTMLFLRNILNRLNDEQINSAFHAFIEEGLEEKLTALIAEGDMDMQASIINEALRDPVILSTLVRSLGRFIVSDFLTYFENLSS
jgi:flavin-dependent dehydrogenase